MPWRLFSPKQLSRLHLRLLGRFGQGRQHRALGSDPDPMDGLLEAGNRLREAREDRGLGLRHLAGETRISTAVLEALEKGWRDRLPEAAYLRTMLPLLEHHLHLPSGSLQGAQPQELSRPYEGRGGRGIRFTPGSIDVFTTWQGTVLYGILIAALIYAFNLQSQRLVAQNLLVAGPLATTPESSPQDPPVQEQPLLEAFPELKPLSLAAKGQGLRLVRLDNTPNKTGSLPRGLLKLQLAMPTSMQLRQQGGKLSRLAELRGELTLSIRPPFQLTLNPPPPSGAVLWDDRILNAAPSSPSSSTSAGAIFRYPALSPAEP